LYRESNPKPTFRRLGEQLGVDREAPRNWGRQDEADHGERDDQLSTLERAEMARLRKENAELRRGQRDPEGRLRAFRVGARPNPATVMMLVDELGGRFGVRAGDGEAEVAFPWGDRPWFMQGAQLYGPGDQPVGPYRVNPHYRNWRHG